jgi:chloride channel 2
MDGRPMKSILKKTNSFSLHNFGQFPSAFHPYMTVTGAESRVRNAFHEIFRKTLTLQDAQPGMEGGSTTSVTAAISPPPAPTPKKTVQLVKLDFYKYFLVILVNKNHSQFPASRACNRHV